MSFRASMRITHKGLILVAVPLIFELIFVAVLVGLLRQADADVQKELKAKTVTQHVALLNKLFFTAAIDIGAYNLTKDPSLKTRFQRDNVLFLKRFRQIKALLADNKQRVEELNKIESDVLVLQETMHQLKAKEPGAVPGMSISTDIVRYFKSSKTLTDLGRRIEKFMEPELIMANEGPSKRMKDRQTIESVIWIGIILNISAAIAVALFFGRSISSRINVLSDNTYRFSKKRSLLPRLSGDDEIARLDAMFHEVVEQIERVDQMKKEFLAVVSHDLKSPLMSVQGTLTLATSGILGSVSEKAVNKLEGAESDVGRLIGLINDLLDTELLDSGEFQLHLGKVSIARVIDRSMISVEALADRKKIQVHSNLAVSEIQADEERLVQVLINLLTNAIKFSPEGSIVEISSSHNESFFELHVKDSGRGISPNQQELIFERFKQVEKSDGQNKKGIGLGLFICKRIIDAHQGVITVSSEPSKGSTFSIRLPLEQLPASATERLDRSFIFHEQLSLSALTSSSSP